MKKKFFLSVQGGSGYYKSLAISFLLINSFSKGNYLASLVFAANELSLTL